MTTLTWANSLRTLVRVDDGKQIATLPADSPTVQALQPRIDSGELVIGDFVPPAAAAAGQ